MPTLLVSVAEVREAVLSGIPLLYTQQGLGVTDALIADNIAAAQNKVGLDLDTLIGPREVRCIADQSDPEDPSDDAIIMPPLDKPRNWFAGDRWGSLKLPVLPAKKILSVTIKPYGWNASPIEIPANRVRLDNGNLRFVPGPMGYLLPFSYAVPAMQLNDGSMLPGALEIVYVAGLTARDLLNKPIIKTLIMLEAAILTLTMVQGRIGGGIAEESVGFDGLTNSVKLGRIDLLGPLGGLLKAYKASYAELLRSAQSELSFRMVWFS